MADYSVQPQFNFLPIRKDVLKPNSDIRRRNMRSSKEEAIGVLNGWKEDKRPVAIFLTTEKGGFIKAGGIVVELTPISVEVFGEDCSVKVFLASAKDFNWSDPREAPTDLRPESEERYESFLEIRGEEYRCLLFAFRLSDERVVK